MLFRSHLPMQETWVLSLGQEDPLEKEIATHSSILAWKIPRAQKSVGVHGVIRVGHHLVTEPPPPSYTLNKSFIQE